MLRGPVWWTYQVVMRLGVGRPVYERIPSYFNRATEDLFDLDRLDDTDPFEIDRQAAHLFKHDS